MGLRNRSITGPTSKPAAVRVGTIEDEPGLLDLLRIDFRENAGHVAPLSEPRIVEFIQTATRQKRATIGVIEGADGLVGMIYLCPEQWWWADSWYIGEKLTFVHPDHRKSLHFARLLKFARWLVDGMTEQVGHRIYLIGSVVATNQVEEKVAAFSLLLNYAGGVYVYPDPGVPEA